MESVSQVCQLCLQQNPGDVSLVSYKCREEFFHQHSARVSVRWNSGVGRLEEVPAGYRPPIRPRPSVQLRGKFVLCDGKRCRGDRCTYPHSVEERDAWNRELEKENLHPTVPPQQVPPMSSVDWPSLSHSIQYDHLQQNRRTRVDNPYSQVPQMSTAAFPPLSYHMERKDQQRQPAWSQQLQQQGKKPSPGIPVANHMQQTPPRFRQQYPQQTNPQPSVVTTPPSQAGIPSQHTPAPVGHPAGAIAASELEFRLLDMPAAQMQLHQQEVSAVGTSQVARLHRQEVGAVGTSQTVRAVGTSQAVQTHRQEATATRSVAVGRGNDALYQQLSLDNYKAKFKQLIEAERCHHEGLLRERCNGSYGLVFAGRMCPKGITIKGYPDKYKFYAFIDGLSSDNSSYINQASDSIIILNHQKREFHADIYRQFRTTRLVACFTTDCSSALPNNTSVAVRFNLKESYFKDLSDSVGALDMATIISRLLPSREMFNVTRSSPNLKDYVQYFSEEQADALRVLVQVPPHAPPLLLNGAFGTGKSRLLALSARYLQSTHSSQCPVRILVCTQQRVSTDKFLDYYLNCVESNTGEVFVIREYGYAQLNQLSPDRRNYYITSKEFQERQNQRRYDNILLITTCLTAPHLKFLKSGYFTHIMVDECSQMREPEAVAPLCLASANTKLIFAGDQNQVGPALLVLGNIAQKNGLGVSLLQRLLQHYQSLGESAACNIITLSKNYRCHPEILQLVDSLFYHCQLSWAEGESLPVTHRDYKYPLVFICSDVDRDAPVSIENEAEIIAERVIKISRSSPPAWPKPPMSELFIVSPSEEQVARLNDFFRKKYPDYPFVSLPDVKSTASIQGRECQAVFLSTAEETHADGSTRNPTRSLCDRYVFNTAVTRARSLVMAVGNPFRLLRMEEQVVRQGNWNGCCWGTFLQLCISNGTLEFSEQLSVADRRRATEQLQECIKKLNSDVEKDLQIKELQAKLQAKALELEQLKLVQPNSVSHANIVQPAVTSHVNHIHPLHVSSQQPPATHVSQVQPQYAEVPQHLPPPVPPEMQAYAMPYQQQGEAAAGFYQASYSQAPHNMENHFPLNPLSQVPPSPAHTAATAHLEEESSIDTNYFSIKGHSHSDMQRVTPTQELSQDYPSPRRLATMSTNNSSRFSKEDWLGSGGFGVVHHVIEKHSGIEYALKVIPLQNDSDCKKRREVTALTKLKYHAIVEYIDSWDEVASSDWFRSRDKKEDLRLCLFILMELCERDTLKHWLLKHRGVNSRNRKAMIDYFEQILDALCFIHTNGCVHRDLKPSNIFFSRESDDKLKVGDFGLVTFDQPPADTTDEFGQIERPVSGSSFHGAGTFPYISPEQQDHTRRKKVDAKTDIYALGIILFELHYPKIVDENQRSDVFNKVRSGSFPSGFKDQLFKVFTVVKSLTATRADRRPSAAYVRMNELVDLKKINRKARKAFVPVL